MLETTALNAYYGEAQALRDVSIGCGAGEVVTLVGRNGAGKTTLLRTIMGLHQQSTGEVQLDGVDLSSSPPHQRARHGLGWVPDDRGIYATLSVEENLTIARSRGGSQWPVSRIYETFPVLADRRATRGSNLSGGEQQMLAIARVLHFGSRVLLLDEPSEGLAPVMVERIGEIIRAAKESGTAVLLVEQNLNFARTVADRHLVVAQGEVVSEVLDHELDARENELLTHLGM